MFRARHAVMLWVGCACCCCIVRPCDGFAIVRVPGRDRRLPSNPRPPWIAVSRPGSSRSDSWSRQKLQRILAVETDLEENGVRGEEIEDEESLEEVSILCPPNCYGGANDDESVPDERYLPDGIESGGEEEDDEMFLRSLPPSGDPFPTAATLAPAENLHGRLLCAAGCAYEIEAPYAQGAGFVAGSKITRLSVGVNSCLVGRTEDGIVVAFRGTQAGSPLDWLQNAAVALRRVPQGYAPRGSRVHEGFYGALRNKLGRAVREVLLRLLREDAEAREDGKGSDGSRPPPPPKVYLTGHSKGGSLASLFALVMHNDEELPDPEGVVTFGAARVGNSEFASHFDRLIDQSTYENNLDIIPFLPPGENSMQDMMAAMEDPEKMMVMMEGIFWSEEDRKQLKHKSWGWNGRKNKPYAFWRYHPIGNRKYISPDRTVIEPVTSDLDASRIRDLERKTLLRFSEFRKAHCSACPDDLKGQEGTCDGGYFSALAPEVCRAWRSIEKKAETATKETKTKNDAQ